MSYTEKCEKLWKENIVLKDRLYLADKIIQEYVEILEENERSLSVDLYNYLLKIEPKK